MLSSNASATSADCEFGVALVLIDTAQGNACSINSIRRLNHLTDMNIVFNQIKQKNYNNTTVMY